MRIHLKNDPAKFHPDLIWNDEVLARVSPQQYEKEQQQQDDTTTAHVVLK